MQSILLRRLDDTVDRCTGLRASWRVSKQPVFSPNDKRLDRPLAAIVIDLKPSVLQKSGELLPLIQTVGDRLSNQTFRQRSRSLLMEPFQISLQYRKASFLPYGMPFFRRGIIQVAFNGKERIAIRQPLTRRRVRLPLLLRRRF